MASLRSEKLWWRTCAEACGLSTWREIVDACSEAFGVSGEMASEAAAPTRHEGAGVARRAAFHERLRAERAELEAAAGAGLPPETDDVALVRAVDVLDGVAEAGRNYTLLKPTEKKKVIYKL